MRRRFYRQSRASYAKIKKRLNHRNTEGTETAPADPHRSCRRVGRHFISTKTGCRLTNVGILSGRLCALCVSVVQSAFYGAPFSASGRMSSFAGVPGANSATPRRAQPLRKGYRVSSTVTLDAPGPVKVCVSFANVTLTV